MYSLLQLVPAPVLLYSLYSVHSLCTIYITCAISVPSVCFLYSLYFLYSSVRSVFCALFNLCLMPCIHHAYSAMDCSTLIKLCFLHSLCTLYIISVLYLCLVCPFSTLCTLCILLYVLCTLCNLCSLPCIHHVCSAMDCSKLIKICFFSTGY